MVSIRIDNPRAADVVELLEAHLAFANAHSAPEDVHALDVDALCASNIDFYTARLDGRLMAVGALKWLGPDHAEIKSMHTAERSRGQGVGRAMLKSLLDAARRRGADRVSLETGTMPAMAPARALYASFGFEVCPPFADYWVTESSVCMTLLLDSKNI